MISAISTLTQAGSSAFSHKSQSAEAAGTSFGTMLGNLASQTVQAVKDSEQTSIAALQGKASVQDVVMKTLAAEESLQAAVAVRDKLISALNEITHMQI